MDATPRADAGLDPTALLEALPDPVVVVGPDAIVRWGNRAATETFGWTEDDLRDRPADHLIHPEDVVTALSSLSSVQAKDVGSLVELRLRARDGRYRRVEVRGRPALDTPGVGGVVMVLRDLGDRHRWEVDGGDGARFRAIIDASPTAVMVLDPAGRLVGASRAFSRLLGRPLEGSLGTVLADLADPASRPLVHGAVAGVVADSRPRTVEARLLRADAEPVAVSLTLVDLVDDPTVAGIVVSATEISELVAARAELEHRATHDHLTGLPGRALLRDRLGHALALARRRGSRVAVVFCDVDRFKDVNDRYGHAGGDEVLVAVAARLSTAARAADTVGRLGGDEFCVVAEDADDALVATLHDRLAEAFRPPVRLRSGSDLVVGVSVGVAVVEPEVGVDGALARADLAMYEAKRTRGPVSRA